MTPSVPKSKPSKPTLIFSSPWSGMAVVLPPILRNPRNSDEARGQLTLLGAMSSHGVSEEEEEEEELSFLAILLAVLRRYLARCMSLRTTGVSTMEIGCPTDVRHVAHVTFDRFHGFLGLPVEFEPEVPRRAPSASTNVFGVSAESMQCSLDSRGNSIPTILLLMQRRLYQQGGLRAEGIFRITAENSQEEHVRDQLNNGIILDGIDVHCLAGLIKAWFRELPSGVLDHLEPEVLLRSQSEEDCARLIKLLPPTQAALLDWAINLMADVVLEKQLNKMNARNIAVVFAPNMTQMADPLTAVMHVVRVMNFLKMLITRTVKEREEAASDYAAVASPCPHDDGDDDAEQATAIVDRCNRRGADSEETEVVRGSKPSRDEKWKRRAGRLRNLNVGRGGGRSKARSSGLLVEKLKGTSIMNNIDSRAAEREAERVEVWR